MKLSIIIVDFDTREQTLEYLAFVVREANLETTEMLTLASD
ncbi:MAG: hypothetical protein WBQ27_17525 [Thermoanaerobaculia bacterium]